MSIYYGIISTASIVPRFTAGVRESSDGVVAAIASRSLAKAAKLATELEIPTAYGSYEELCADPKIDVIYIPTYNAGHFPAAKLALTHHKHVLVEKPFTLTLQEAAELFNLAAKNKCFIMEGQKSLFLPVTQQVKTVINYGRIGELRFIQSMISYPDVSHISWFDSLEKGGGALYGSGSYPIEYLQYITDSAITQYGGTARMPAGRSDSQCDVSLRLGADLLANVCITTDLDLPNKLMMYGTKGHIEVIDFWKAQMADIFYLDGSREQLTGSFTSEFFFEVEHVNQCIQDGRLTSPLMTEEMTLSTVAMVEKLYQQWR